MMMMIHGNCNTTEFSRHNATFTDFDRKWRKRTILIAYITLNSQFLNVMNEPN